MLAVDLAVVAAPAAAAATKATDLAPLASAEPAKAPLDTPDGDFTNPPPSAGRKPELTKRDTTKFDPATATPVASETTPTRAVYAQPDGTRTAVVSTRPVRYRDDAGAWRDIDVELVTAADGDKVAKADKAGARFASRAPGAVVEIPVPGGTIALSHPGAADKAATTAKNQARYADALSGGRDLLLDRTVDGFNESVVLPDAAAGGTYQVELALPAGYGARQSGAIIEIVDPEGAPYAVYGGGLALDGAKSRMDRAEADVASRLVSVTGSTATIEVSVDPAWLADPARVFPVTIDPEFQVNTTTSGPDTWIQNNIATAQYSSTTLRAGSPSLGVLSYSMLHFDLGTLPGANVQLWDAHVALWETYAPSCTPREVIAYPLLASLGNAQSTIWGTAPAFDQGSPGANNNVAKGFSGACPGGWIDVDTTSMTRAWMTGAATAHGVVIGAQNETDTLAYKEFASGETGAASAPTLIMHYNTSPATTVQAGATPVDKAVLATTTPTLSVNQVTDRDGDPVKYWFRVTTGADAETGAMVQSGWLNPSGSNPVTWTAPPGSLTDGATYYWHVWTWDDVGGSPYVRPAWVSSFKVDTRMGDQPAVPADGAGPVGVNLFNGNVTAKTSSPTFSTVGGPIGLSYSYNSQAPSSAGLTGRYVTDLDGDHIIDAGEAVSLTRQDPQVSFDWGWGSPAGAALQPDNFIVTWTGWVTVPTSATDWQFGAARDDGVRITVNNALVVNSWVDQATGTPGYGATSSLTAGVPVPIKVEFYERGGGAMIQLYAKATGQNEVIVPANWLSTDPPPLPRGWQVSADLDGALSYSSARINADSVSLIDASGAPHTYVATGTGFKPPLDDDGVLARDAKGLLTFVDDDGTTYVFDDAGNITSATSGLDDRTPAAATYTWAGTPKRLTEVVDPVSGRKLTLTYGGGTCPAAPAGLTVAPTAMLCQVTYPDASVTKVFYDSTDSRVSRLRRIEDPGGEVTDLAYDSGAKLTEVRDPAAADAVAAGVRADDATTKTAITYSGAKAASVTLPAPTPGALRPARTYGYPSATQSTVTVAGITGVARTVTFDAAGRLLTDTDATGKTASATWDEGDRKLSTTDPAGRKSTTIYDDQQRPTDTYGPAPAAWFGADNRPTAGNLAATPHTATEYDGGSAGIGGLAAAYYENRDLSGPAKIHATGVGGAGGSMVANWVAAKPDAGLSSADNWSARYSGDVELNAASTYTFKVGAEPGQAARLFVDDKAVVDTWSGLSGFDSADWTGDGSIHMVARGTGEALQYRGWNPATGWDATWEDLGGILTSDPTIVARADGNLDVFARGQDNALWWRAYDPANDKWADWAPLGGTMASAPDAASWNSGRMDVFYKDTTGRMAQAWWDGTWHAPQTIGSEIMASDPGAVSWGTNRIDVFYKDPANAQLRHRWWNGSTWGSEGLGGVIGSGPDVSSWAPGRLDIFALGGDKAMYQMAWNGSAWDGFYGFGGTFTTDPTVVSRASGALDVFAQGGDNQLWQRGYSTGSGWWVAWGGIMPTFRVGTFTTPAGATKRYRLRLETNKATGNGRIDLRWVPPAQADATIPGSALTPRYGLVTKTTTDDATTTGSPPQVTTTDYFRPHNGLATTETTGGLATQTAYEAPGTGAYARRVSRTLPGGNAASYSYYGTAEAPLTTTCAGAASAQMGLAKQTTGPDPDGAGPGTARVEQAVYDSMGRTVASRISTTGSWSCLAYDSRGRVTSSTVPAFGAEPARTVTTNYAVGGNPLVSSVTDAAGTVTTATDLLGRATSYTDAWNKVTTSTYDQAGRLTDTAGPAGAQHNDYDNAGRVTAQKLDGVNVAVPTYSTAGELATVSYPSGTGNGGNATSGTVTRDNSGRTSGLSWSLVGSTVSDAVSYTQGGRVINQLIDGVDARPSFNNFTYDAAGRLTAAWVPGHTLSYAFAASGGCGYATLAGTNTNRTSMVDNGATTTYCYDAADKITSTSDARYGAITYDAHGSTATIGGQTLGYDGADRHVSTVNGGSTVRYVRDATDRIVERKLNGATVARYGYSGGGDSSDFTMDGTGAVIERSIGLIGGASITKRTAGDVWSYPNIHGDIATTANAAGAKQGATLTYDPYGQALAGLPDNSAGNLDYGWLGKHQRGLEHEGTLATIEMGARQYVPGLGRFLQVDPVEGGSANDYDYVGGDPVNRLDIAGDVCFKCLVRKVVKGAKRSVRKVKYRGDRYAGCLVSSPIVTRCARAGQRRVRGGPIARPPNSPAFRGQCNPGQCSNPLTLQNIGTALNWVATGTVCVIGGTAGAAVGIGDIPEGPVKGFLFGCAVAASAWSFNSNPLP